MKQYSYILVVALLAISLSGCKGSVEEDKNEMPASQSSTETVTEQAKESAKEPTQEAVKPITEDDFEVSYKGISFGPKTTIQELKDTLHMDEIEEGTNIELKARSSVNDRNVGWNILHYPSKEEEEIQIEYIYTEEEQEGRIVCLDLKQQSTARGICIGDPVDKVKEAYGDSLGEAGYNSASEDYFEIEYNKYLLHICYDKSSDIVTRISIDYDTNQVIDELDLCFD